MANAANVACTPASTYTSCTRITASGADQTFTVPPNVTSIDVKVWGAAGGGANAAYYSGQSGGAGGGFSTATVAVTPGQILTLVVGSGGVPNSIASPYGGGGAGGNSTGGTQIGGSGGGMSAIFLPGGKTAANALVVAGGGGGASPGADAGLAGAGGGGGNTGGQDTLPIRSGRGGTGAAGGAAATGTSACSVVQTAGSQFQGGRGGASNGVSSNEGGGGGGGGYFGGGGGLCQNSASQNGGGGGGSSFTTGTGVTAGATTAGANFIYANVACSGTANSGGSGDAFYSAGIGIGSCYGTGGNGEIVIQFKSPVVRVQKISNGGTGTFTFGTTTNLSNAVSAITTISAGTAAPAATTPITATAAGTAITIAEDAQQGFVLNSASCTDANSATTGNTAPVGTLSGNILTIPATAVKTSANLNCIFTNTKTATVTLTKVSNGSVGSFSFNSAGASNGFAAQNITTTTSGVGVSGATQTLTAAATATTLTETIPAGYVVTSGTCTGTAAGNITFNPLATATTATIVLNTTATAVGNVLVCTFTNTKTPTVKFQKKTLGDTGSSPSTFSFNTPINIASAPAAIATTAANTAAPVAPTAINVTTIGSAVSLTEVPLTGYVLSGFACSDANNAITLNPASFGTFSGNTGTIPAANVVAGTDATCIFTNTKLPTVQIAKISNGSVGTFSFSGDNGFGSDSITTVTSGTAVNGVVKTLTGAATATTLTETIPAGYAAASGSCTGTAAGNITFNPLATATTATITLNPTATAAGNALVCTFTNTKLPILTLVKTVTNDSGGTLVANTVNLTATGPSTITGVTGAGTVTNAIVPVGTYVLSEANPANYTAGAWSCTAGTLTGNSLVLAAGQNATCTINNNDIAATLTLVKSVTNDNGGTLLANTVNLTATGPTTITGVTGAGTVTAASVNAGTYTLTEANPAGYAAGAWSCTAGTLTGNSLVLALNQTSTCTINDNDVAPQLTLVKSVTNDNGGTLAANTVALTATGPTTITGNSGSATVTAASVNAGTYTLSEVNPANYVAGAWSCTAGTLTGSSLVLAVGDVSTCTINNNDTGPKLTLVKTVTNDNGGTLVANTVTLTASGPTPISGVTGAGTVTAATVSAGTYTLSEAATPGYTQGAWSCSAGTLTGNSLVLALGQVATCTINNNDTAPLLTLVKSITNDNGGTVLANSVSLSAVGPVSIAGTTGQAAVTGAAVNVGTYTLSEANPAGYAAGAWSCTAGTLTGSSLVLALGQTATCTINDNDISPLLTLAKTVTNDNGGTLAANTVTLTATGPTTITGITATAAVTNAAVDAGTYTLTEAATPGYAQGAWSCSAGTLTGNSLVLAPGQSASCTINNNDVSPKLTLVKMVTNDNGGTLAANTVTLTANGPSPISGVTGAAAITGANVNAGTYTLTEAATPGYTQGAWSCTAGTLSGNSLVLTPGQTSVCTVVNDDNGPVLTLVKTITNDNGGLVAANSVSLSATGPVSIAGVTGSAAVTSATINAGTYALSEANPSGYAAGAWSCTAGTLTGSSLVLALGQISTCTINDNDISPVLTLLKTVTNDNGGTVLASSVNLTATGPTTITGASGAPAVTNASVNPGTYTLTEVNPVGYAAGSWSCTGGTLTGNSLVLALGQSASCTINDNDVSPTLTLVKTVTNDDGGPLVANTVNLTATGPTTITGVTGNAAITTALVNAGVYTLTEASVPGYSAGAWSCTAGTLSGSILTLAPGQSPICTINNNDIAPKLTLVKSVTNDDGGTAATTAFTLSATGPSTITGVTGAAAVTNANVKVGSYALSETGPGGYAAGAWGCSAGTLVGNNLTLAAGEVATCTINNNDVAPILTLAKTVTNDNGGTVAANTVSLSAVGPVSAAGVTGAAAVTNAVVKAGVYVLSEANPTGYTAGSWSCSSGTLVGSNLTLANGQSATCTINDNDISPILTLTKTVTNDNGGVAAVSAFTLTAAGPTPVTGISGAAAVTGAAVDAGTYTLSESGPAGYTAGSWSCSAGTLAGSSLTLAPGQTAVCSINNNDDPAKLTLVKTVISDNGGVSVVADFTLKATGPTTISGITSAPAVTNATVNAGTYALTETGPAGYLQGAWSCDAGILTGSSLVLGSGQNAICTVNNDDIAPRLTLAKTVTNDNGGVSVVANFTLSATGPISITGVTGAAAITNAAVSAGTYALSETGPLGYTAGAWSCTAGTLVGSNLTLALNQTATCTINNNDISPKLTLVKTVTNDSGGSNVVADFTLKATGPTTIIGLTGSASVTNANVNVGTYALSETGPSGYTAGAWSCDAGTLVGSNLTLALNQSATCTINNDDTPATITLNKISNGGTGAFTFNGTNGFGAPQTITTIAQGASVAGAPRTLAASSTATTITETIPIGYGLTAASCTGLGAGTATPNLLTGVLSLDSASTAPGNAVNCTFTNGVASFTVAKSANIANISAPGPITYTITVANTGQADLTSPTISDNFTQGGSPKTLSSGPTLVSGDTVSPGVLNVGETWVYTASYIVTQADIDNGGTFSNSATFDTLQTNPSGSAPAVTTVTQLPQLAVNKSSTTPSFNAVGDPISYTYVVRNSGNTTITGTISVSDNKTSVVCPALPATLAPNDTKTCTSTYLASQADIDAGGVTNTATTTDGTTISPPVQAFVPSVKTPNMTVDKVATTVNFINPGDIVSYKYTITNSGNTTLAAPFVINDNLIPSVNITCPATTLLPTNTLDCTGSYAITQDDLDLGRVTNLATATSGTTTSPQTTQTVPIGNSPALSITKATSPAVSTYTAVGDVIAYDYVVTNTGSATLTRLITVIDDKIGSISCHTPPPNFIPGDTQNCSATYTITQADLDRGFVTNQATANTTFGGSNIPVVSPPASATANAIQNPLLLVTKSVAPAVITGLGQVLTYTIDVKNVGNITISNINVSDPLIPALACNIAALVPTANDNTCTGTYTVTQADVDAGAINNTATATGVTPQGAPVLPPATGTKTVTVPQVKTMSVVKTLSSNADQDASSSITLGDTLTYSVAATNTGTVTQTNVLVIDNKILPNSKSCLIVAPSATCILTGTYTVTQADVDFGSIGNTGTLTSDIVTTPQTSVVNTPVAQLSQLTTLKTKTGFTNNDANPALTVGDTLHYTVTATNSGTVTQNNVVVSDPLLTPSSNTCATLAIGAVCTLTGDHVVTALEATNGVVNNTGSAMSTLVTSPVTSSISTPVTRIITAVNDAPASVVGATGAPSLINAYNNDTLNGITVGPSPTNVTGTVLSPATPIAGGPVPTLDVVTGIVTVPAGTPASALGVPYVIQYQICEVANPINCSVASISVTVDPAPIVVSNDTATGVNGATGATAITNAFNGDTINGSAATPSNSILSAITAVPAQLVFDPATGNVDVQPGTPAGTYTFDYQICEKLNPSNCQIATISVNVVAAPLVATNDTPLPVNGATGNPSLIDAYANDTLNGVAVSLGTITGTVVTPATPIGGGPVPVLDPATGLVSVPAGTPAGPYTITYQICEQLNPISNCKTATISVVVTAAPIIATNDTPLPVNGATANPSLINAYTNDTLNGVPVTLATITGSVLTPATPASVGAPVPALDPTTGVVAVPAGTPAGTYTIHYKICEQLNPLNCAAADVIVIVDAAPIVATNDTPLSVNGATGNPSVVNAYANDLLNGAPVTLANIVGSIVTPATPIGGGSVPSLNPATGIVSVPPGTPAGSYTITYKICEKLNPSNCQNADIAVVVDAAPILASADTPSSVNGATGNPSLTNAYTNDTLNGTAVTLANITGTVLTPATPLSVGALVPALDPATGTVSVPAGTPAGNYTISYQICENLNPANCSISTVIVVVTAAPILATADTPPSVNGATGNPSVVDAYANDTLNGIAVTLANINGSVLTPATPLTVGAPVPLLDPSTGTVTVPPATPAGTYTIHYQICEKLNPSNCSVADVTVVVDAAPILATNDAPLAVNGATGNPSVVDAYANDTLNSVAVTLGTINGTVLTPATPNTVGALVPVLDPATGNVSVPAGTPAGPYTIQYKICEKLNPLNCSVANVNVVVSAALIVATTDTPPPASGLMGNPSVVDAYANDMLNGVPVTLATITGTVTTPATPATIGAPVPALDPSTGTVSVPPNTPAGTYTIAYKICEKLNPTNCSASTITVVVDAAPIVATNDAPAPVNGATGSPSLTNAYTNDTLNGVPVIISNITGSVLTPATPLSIGAPVPALDPSTGVVSVPAGTPAGTYTIQYKICENLNPANCSVADVTVVVNAAPIVATNDIPPSANGATGNASLINAYSNDTLNGSAATISTITGSIVTPATPASVGAPVPVLDPATGNVSVPAGTPAGSYTVTYKICEQLNPSNCSTANISVVVTAAPIVATNDTPPPVIGATGNPSVVNAYTNDLLNGVQATPATITGSVLTPATPASVGAPVPLLDPVTGVVSIPPSTPAGTYTIHYQICEKLNVANCAVADVIVVVDPTPIAAINDTPLSVNGATGNPSVVDAYTNDTLNSLPVTLTNITGSVLIPATPVSVGALVPVMNAATGTVSVPPGTPASTYTIHYQICENLNPGNCSVADVIVIVDPAPLLAVNDTVSGINGATGATAVVNAFTGDTLNGLSATAANSILSVSTAVPPQLVFNIATGSVDVLPGTPAGPYTFDYKICEQLNLTNCKIATITVNVVGAPIMANPDTPPNVNGAIGNPSVVDAYANDTLNGVAVTLTNITGTVTTPATPIGGGPVPVLTPATGTVSVPPGTPAGTYTIAYQICEQLNPLNCSNSTVTVVVDAAAVVATSDTVSGVNGANGLTAALNAFTADSINGAPATIANSTIVLAVSSTVPPQLVFSPATGAVDVQPGTPIGTYTFDYTLCEILNPTNCKTATETVNVVAAPLVATNDNPPNVNGAAGNPTLVDAFANDSFNGAPVDLAKVTATITTPAVPATVGANVPALDLLTGNVSVPPGTPSGTYTITYQLCENLNPVANCMTAVVTVLVDAAPIVATVDTPAATIGATGNPALVNAYDNDSLNGVQLNTPALVANVIGTVTTPATPASVGAPVPVLDPVTGVVSVPAGTPAGVYAIDYKICEKLNPANCASTTVTIPVTAAPIVANADTPLNVNGAVGNPSVANAYANDTLNGAAFVPTDIIGTVTAPATPVSVGAPVPVLDPVTGVVSVPAGTPSGPYTIAYQICEKLNPLNCAPSTVVVNVDAAAILAVLDTPVSISGFTGGNTPTVLGNDTLNGLLVVPAEITLTPGTAPTPTAGSITMNADGSITVAAGTTAGSYPYTYTICEKLNPLNCSNATANVVVDAAAILAVLDTPVSISGFTGGNTPTVLGNDTLNGVPVVLADINFTPGIAPSPATGSITMNPDGTITVAAGTTAGSYPYTYTICEKLNPLNCSNTTATVAVGLAPILAFLDTPVAIDGYAGGNTPTVLSNDTLNGVPVVPANITLTPGTAPTPAAGSITMNPDGTITVAAGTTANSYPYTYTICENLNPLNCSTTTATVVVAPPAIVAIDDTLVTPLDSKDPLPNVVNVLTNDTLNGAAIDPTKVTVTPVGTLPAGITLNANGSVDLAQFIATGTYQFNYQVCEILNPINCKTAKVTIPVLKTVPKISGTVFFDTNGNGILDGAEVGQPNFIVQLLAPDGSLVTSTTTAADGTYTMSGFDPGTTTTPISGFKIVFIDPATGVAVGSVKNVTIGPATILTNQDQPIDPSGVIYNSNTGAPVAGATVTITTAGGAALPVACLLPGQQSQTTSATGAYRFDIVTGANPLCPLGVTEYRLSIVSPAGYSPAPSTIIAPQAGAYACAAVSPAQCLLSPSSTPPAVGAPTPYYLALLIGSATADTVNNHIPLDPILISTATFTKTALKTEVHRGERVPYVIQATAMSFTPADVVDIIPPGFDYVPGSALVNGVAATPTISGNQLTFSSIAAVGGVVKVELTLIANAAVQPGPATNKAQLLNSTSGALVATARATVTVVAEPVFDCGEIIGRVFEDANRNGYQDEGEKGLPGVRIATVKGVLVTTDKFGRFHVACADMPDHDIGSNFVMKLDTRTLPTGYRLTTENPRDVRLTAGKMTKLNFGASIAHLVDLDLNGKVFKSGSTELLPQWSAGLATLIAKLDEEPSTLRLTYHTESEPTALASKRLRAVATLITTQWNKVEGRYKLPIETRSVDAKGGAQ